MVTGGSDSTEIFSDNTWKTVAGTLPGPMYGLMAVTINNRVLLFGNRLFLIKYKRNLYFLRWTKRRQ